MRNVDVAETEDDVRDNIPTMDDPMREGFEAETPAVSRRTVEPVDRLEEDELEAKIGYVHDSDYHTTSFAPIREVEYRMSRSDMDRMRKGLRYGQYLELPKGRRSIFGASPRKRIILTALTTMAVLAALALVAYLLWGLVDKVF